MRPLRNIQIHSDTCFSIGEADFCRTNRVNFKEVKCEHSGKQILPEGKVNIGQSSINRKNKNFRTDRLASQILISKSHPSLAFCGSEYYAVVSLC